MKNKVSAAAWSASITMIIMVMVIILAEYVASFKSFLASITGHHWVTKSVLEVILFIVLFLVIGMVMKKDKKESMKGIVPMIVVAIASITIIVGFFIFHFMGE
jgi:amino acid permease